MNILPWLRSKGWLGLAWPWQREAGRGLLDARRLAPPFPYDNQTKIEGVRLPVGVGAHQPQVIHASVKGEVPAQTAPHCFCLCGSGRVPSRALGERETHEARPEAGTDAARRPPSPRGM